VGREVTFEAYTGVVQDGPLKGKVQTKQSRRFEHEGGFYYFRPRQGPVAAQWIWVPKKDDKA
jgi:hypothetical protein